MPTSHWGTAYKCTHSDLYKEISQMFLEGWDVLIEAEEPLNKHFDLCTAK